MGIKFYKLLDLLNRKGVSKEELRKKINISSSTMAKISKNEYVSLKVVESICRELDCQPGDVMEYIPEDK
ncbi:MAG: helix-turn-helix transcriptional regulator [Intestinibacter bartlettii]|jgi:DNA-binding Xre family transcriptional regulator|nr:helix-turn-helix transcriptional regulator [Intestinibacter bartlettii]